MKYGNSGSKLLEPIPTKYAYVPFGYSGVLPYLPLCWSKSPALVKL